jgi:uncharacterized SAM-binding protein YcdF (DUF218 family)
MFFYLSKTLTFLIDPFFITVLLLLFLWLRSRSSLRVRLITLALILFIITAAIPRFADQTMHFLERLEPSSHLSDRYDAVIVLTGMVDLTLSTEAAIEFNDAVERILVGIGAVRNGWAENLIISGGESALHPRHRSEATLLKEFAQRWGVDEKRIIIDPTSRNTYENAVNTKALIKEAGWHRLLLVTSAFHMYRARGCFRAVDLDVDVLPVDFRARQEAADFRDYLPTSHALFLSSRVLHEMIGIAVYRLLGRARYS